jgi:ADP-heptose:LPS heptosyltransferase
VTILVVRTDKLGDFITALPTLYALKHYDSENRIVACVAPLNRELAAACDFIDEVVVDTGEGLPGFAMKLRALKADASVTLFSNTRVALAQFLARIPRRIAPATKLAQFFYTDRITQRRSRVEMAEYEYNLQLAGALFPKMDIAFRRPLLQFAKEETDAVYRAFCTKYDIGKPIAAFHPGSGGSTEANWSLDQYIELIRTMQNRRDVQVVMTFGPDESALRQEAAEKAAGLDIVFYTSKNGLVDFAKLLASFRLFVSTSTGTYHLAAAVGTPTMTFFGDSRFASVKRWKAVSDPLIQHPYMLSTDADRRAEQFKGVKEDLRALLAQYVTT